MDKRRNRCLRSFGVGVFALFVILPLFAYGSEDYNPRPYEISQGSLPREKQDLFYVVTGTRGDGEADTKIQACMDLIADQGLSEEVRRWATLEMVHLYMVNNREEKAIAIAKEWLAAHPNHVLAQRVRARVASMYSKRKHHEGFEPTSAEVEAAYNEVFRYAEQEPLVTLNARYDFFIWLTSHRHREEEGMAILDAAIAEGRAYLDSPVAVPESLREGMTLLERAEWLAKDAKYRESAVLTLGHLEAAKTTQENRFSSPEMLEQIKESQRVVVKHMQEMEADRQAEKAVEELLDE